VMRLAAGLTIWFSASSALLLILMLSRVKLPDSVVLLPVLVSATYFLLPVRWVLILVILINSVRAKPLKRLPRAPGIQVAFVVLVQLVLGIMSIIGLILLWTDTPKIGDRVAGFVFHACVPVVMVLFLARRANTVALGSPPPVPTL
jgi:hypothetical protein